MVKKKITPSDILPLNEYAQQRETLRKEIIALKKKRRVAIGPHATALFENARTILYQIQEMLFVEKGGEFQIPDEVEAYTPLIPQGDALVMTLMFEVNDPQARLTFLRSLPHVEEYIALRCGDEKIKALPVDDHERTREDGKTSAVHFLKFPFSEAQKAYFKKAEHPVIIAIEHPHYFHLAALPKEVWEEVSGDLV